VLAYQPGQARLGREQAAGEEDQPGDDALEQRYRADQQQRGADHGPDRAGGAEGENAAALAAELAPVAERPAEVAGGEHRSAPAEHGPAAGMGDRGR
jgi:hypothetical protein